jgi:hypothetical protein
MHQSGSSLDRITLKLYLAHLNGENTMCGISLSKNEFIRFVALFFRRCRTRKYGFEVIQ